MRPPARWQLPNPDPQVVEAIATGAGLEMPAARVLARRGISTASEALGFLNPGLHNLHDPFLLRDMNVAADRLLAAVEAGERILIYGDYDVDGITSIVLLKKAIELAGGRAEFHVPHRIRDGYGMRDEVIEQAAREGVRLIISADTGIRAAAAVRHAVELGLDVIVTDHHLPEEELPPAIAVLNPNRVDCGYPDKNLCGAGVAFKLAQALFVKLGWPEEKRRRIAGSFLKLVAIATVADVVPLTGENRAIVRLGLDGLRSVTNTGLRALLNVAGYQPGEALTARGVAFRVAPRLNAAGRMDDPSAAVELFLSDDPERARELAARLDQLNSDRRNTDAGIYRQILDLCERDPVTDEHMVLVFSAPGWNRGVIGIVAGRLAEQFHRPVFVLSEDPETGEAHGSARSAGVLHMVEALESMPDLFLRFGGHSHAAGLSLPSGKIGEFRSRINSYAAGKLTPEDLRQRLDIDAVVDLAELTPRVVAELAAMEPFGHRNPPPLLAAMGVQIVSPADVFTEKHLKLRVRRNSQTLLLKGWGMAERAGEIEAGARVDVAFVFSDGEATLRDFRRSS